MTRMREIQNKIENADAILIAASNGLSISEGYHLFADNPAFRELFSDFRTKYGIRCIIQGMTYPYKTEEETWAFWSRLITLYVHSYTPTCQMKELKKIVGKKPYFIITSNAETHFEIAGFDSKKIYEIEGTLIEMQCAKACHKTIYPVTEMIEKMAAAEKDGLVPSELVPRCPICGGSMQLRYGFSPSFIQDEDASERYMTFIDQYYNQKLVILELGIGAGNRLIKEPLMKLAASGRDITYITINKGEIYIAGNIKDKSFGLDGDLTDILAELSSALS